ncbi:hypothetical protein [Acidisoma silvae]|uniref:Tyrosine specific protein phosphatases domain-containing protein n=1 Tax=Acidisoma silvae TaxID=2802396 RepID=A0A964E1Q9_9PROT|nr:hypothetical protein [Acidisoma silvae]MCB8878028.1 hypothetical protein [Acidisoma silvae]
MRIKILSRSEVENGAAEGADAVISIQGAHAATNRQLDLALAQVTGNESARLLKLRFDDIGVPRYRRAVGPTMQQIDAAIAFGRLVRSGADFFDGPPAAPPTIAVHCEYGRSRSAAIGLALLADFLGDGREQAAVNALLRLDIQNQMQPNPFVINLADAAMFRYGRIDAALSALSPRYMAWRKYWREIRTQSELQLS